MTGDQLLRLRARVPAACFEVDALRSTRSVARDVAIVAALYTLHGLIGGGWTGMALHVLWWFALGTCFGSLFVVAHDALHGTFSRNEVVNAVVGHLAFLPLLLPYWGSRATHLRHHAHTNHVDRDTQFRPLREEEWPVRPFRTLYGGEPSRGLAWDPRTGAPERRRRVRFSAVVVLAWLAAWVVLTPSWTALIDLYVLPWMVGTAWTQLVTWLHHTHPHARSFDDESWDFVEAQLEARDRSYGWLFDRWLHNPGWHVAEHLFPGQIPHAHWRTASEAVQAACPERAILDRSPLWVAVAAGLRCRVVIPHPDGRGFRWR